MCESCIFLNKLDTEVEGNERVQGGDMGKKVMFLELSLHHLHWFLFSFSYILGDFAIFLVFICSTNL